jgi:hypothetical protein
MTDDYPSNLSVLTHSQTFLAKTYRAVNIINNQLYPVKLELYTSLGLCWNYHSVYSNCLLSVGTSHTSYLSFFLVTTEYSTGYEP